MASKFMKIFKYVIPTLTMVLIASQLMGCAAVTDKELLSMYERQEAITIEIAEPVSIEQGEEMEIEWIELAYLDTYPEFREIFDDTIGVTIQGNNGKNGVVYVDLEGKHTNNSTLRFAFANSKFLSKLWNNTDNLKTLEEAVENIYADVDGSAVAKLAMINAYFNIFPDAEPNYFNGSQTLSRSEFLAGVYRAETPVCEINARNEFLSSLLSGEVSNEIVFASQIMDYSYLTLEDKSLNPSTSEATITRAEAVYTLVKKYFPEEFARVNINDGCYSDAKNGGDIALKAGFKDKETGAVKDYWKSYELSYALKNPDKGMPEELYRAMVVAKNKGLITGDQSRWDDGLTKGEALNLITRVYQSIGTITSADRGASQGQVVNNNNPGIENPSNQGGTNGTEGVVQVVEKVNTPSIEADGTIDENDFTYDESGKLETSEDLVTLLKSFDGYDEFNDDQIQLIIESKEFETQYNWGKQIGDIEGQLAKEFGGKENVEYLKVVIPGLSVYADTTLSQNETPSILDTNTGAGEIVMEDGNNGGSDEDEVADDDFMGIAAPTEEIPEYNEDEEVKIETSSDTQYSFTPINQTMYASKDVNFRKGPSTDYDKLGNLYAGEKVMVIAQCNETNWYLIKTDRLAEFVYVTDTYITAENPYAEQAPVENETPKPTEKPVETTNQHKPGRATVESYTITTQEGEKITLENVSGQYVKGDDNKTYFVADGLGETFQTVTITSSMEELWAWMDTYPDYSVKYTYDENGRKTGGTLYMHDRGETDDTVFDLNLRGY